MLSVTGDYQNIDKTNFTAIFKESFERSMSLATIKNGFRKTGIYPFNPEAIDKTRLIPIEPSPSSTPVIQFQHCQEWNQHWLKTLKN